MSLRILEGETRLINLRTRMPFKYGIATMTDVPYAFLRLRVEIHGAVHDGFAADNMPPKWFTKVPDDPLDKEIADMLRVIRRAMSNSLGVAAPTAFAAWRTIYGQQAAWAKAENIAP